MLEELSIRNFAIIDDLHLRFGPGLTILSGETGAGKSIIVNAVNLLLGARASSRMIRSGSKTAEVEALFRIPPDGAVAKQVAASGLAGDDEQCLLVRRVVARNNRHRIYINDRLATVQAMSRLTENLASISGQHAHQRLLKEENHLLILDQFAGLLPLRAEVAGLYRRLLPLVERRQKLLAAKRRQAEQLELLTFQRNEIRQAGLEEDEDLRLEQQRRRLKNMQSLFAAVHRSLELLYNADGAVLEQLAEVEKELEGGSRIDPGLADLARAVSDTVYRVEDLNAELRSYLKGLETDQDRLEEVEARLDLINRLKRKYGPSLQKVLEYGRNLEKELESVAGLDMQIGELEEELGDLHSRLCEACSRLSKARRKACSALAARIEAELADLQMEGTRFEVLLEKIGPPAGTEEFFRCSNAALTETGCDKAVFMIAPNVGEELKPLASIASGGELSRVVLAVKVILAGNESVETLIFDEVDAGIGGRTAEMVGSKLASCAEHHQTLCITHLPQIAKFGHQHLRISKRVKKGRTITSVEPLTREQRIEELARMIGGRKITPTTLAHAREMLEIL